MELRSTKLLFLYRSFLFKKVFFKTKDKELKKIVRALNMKKKYKRVAYIYDEAIKEIDKYYGRDLCRFENNQCIAQRLSNRDDVNGCCFVSCPCFGEKGCISVNLPCRMIYCKAALKNLKRLKLRNIKLLKALPIGSRIILRTDFFSTREEVLSDLRYGLIIYSFRCIGKEIKLFKNRIKKHS